MDGPLLIGEALEVAGHARADKPVDPGDASAIQVTRSISTQPQNLVSIGWGRGLLSLSCRSKLNIGVLGRSVVVLITRKGSEESKRSLGGLALTEPIGTP
jgi:hypothetical protein